MLTEMKRTLSVDPQEGTRRLPFNDNLALKEPRCRSVVLGLSCSDVIRGRVSR